MSQTIPSAASLDPTNQPAEILPSVDSVAPRTAIELALAFLSFSEGFRFRFYVNRV